MNNKESVVDNVQDIKPKSSRFALASLTQAFFTLCSRILGMLRDMATFHFFGATSSSDAFLIAFTIPNVLRRFLGEGSLGIAFVPYYMEQERNFGKEKAKYFFSNVFGALTVLLFFITILGVIFAKYLVLLFAAGIYDNSEQFLQAVKFARIMFPYCFFMCLTALLGAHLQCFFKYAAMAAAPILLNLAFLIGIYFCKDFFQNPIEVLSWSVLVGGVWQLSLLIIASKRANIWALPKIKFDFANIKEFSNLLWPALFGIFVYQLNIIALRQLASFLPHGQITYYYNADRLTQFAVGVFIVSLSLAALPEITLAVLDKTKESLQKVLDSTLAINSFLVVPCVIGLIVFARPIVFILYRHGAFSAVDAEFTAQTLMFFAPSILPLAISRILTQVFYAHKDTKTPVKIGFYTLLMNILLGVIFLQFEIQGLALALSLATFFQSMLLYVYLKKKVGFYISSKLLKTFYTHLILSFIACFAVSKIFGQTFFLNGLSVYGAVILCLVVLVSAIFYFALDWFVGSKKAREIFFAAKKNFISR